MRLRSSFLSLPSSIQRLAASRIPPHHPVRDMLFRPGRSFASQTWQTLNAPEIPSDELVDEERVPYYKPEHFYPANPGDILDKRYELKAKVGWGSSSTVWLAHDISRKKTSPKRYVAIKICTSNSDDETHELDLTIHVDSLDSQHKGRGIIGTAIESFGIELPRGPTHLALVFEPLRDPLWLFIRRITGQDMVIREVLPLIKVYLRFLLEGLDFLHSECHIIHADLKPDNIMVTFEDPSVIETYVQEQSIAPMARKRVGTRTVYQCHNNFGDIQGDISTMFPQITDLGLAQRGDEPGQLMHPIQPNYFQAPEVLLGVGWSYSADIWNFGIMVWELLTGRLLFKRGTDSYSAIRHLADMIAIIGPVPPELLQREKSWRCWRCSDEILNSNGQLCGNAAEFYGGPFFTDDEGTFIGNHLVPKTRMWENEAPECISKEEIDAFFGFMRRMLAWLPEDRATAGELKDDPWLYQ